MVTLRPDFSGSESNGIKLYLRTEDQTSSDKLEATANNRYEKSIDKKLKATRFFQILSKANFINTFLHLKSVLKIQKDSCVLELGGSHGWATALLKHENPQSYFVLSDLVPECLEHSVTYEEALGVRIDSKMAINVRNTPFANEQFDLVFTFAAFHHFFEGHGDFEKATKEIYRILKKGGILQLIYEPSSPSYLYPLARKRANKRLETEGVEEDLIVISRLKNICASLGAEFSYKYETFYLYRSPLSTIYYFFLAKLPLLKFILPCTVSVTIKKPNN